VKAGDNMRSICAIGALVFALGAAFPAQRRNLELENVAAMARLYGVVRYFYPGDAAAALDWNRFALHASREVLSARNREELASRLNSLFAQVGGGIVVAAALPPAPHGGAVSVKLPVHVSVGDPRGPRDVTGKPACVQLTAVGVPLPGSPMPRNGTVFVTARLFTPC